MHLQDSDRDLLQELAERCIDKKSIFLVDLEAKGKASNPTFWVYLDSDTGGISLNECAEISRKLQVLIEANGVFGSAFTLNVSSPGLDKPLKLIRQYKSNEGRNATVRFKSDETVKMLEGTITVADDEGIEIENEGKKTRLGFSDIIETKIQPAF